MRKRIFPFLHRGLGKISWGNEMSRITIKSESFQGQEIWSLTKVARRNIVGKIKNHSALNSLYPIDS